MPVQQVRKRSSSTPDGAGATAEGGQMLQVRIGAFPGGKLGDHEFPEGTTVGEALREAGLEKAALGADIRINGRPVEHDHVLQLGDQLLVFKKVRGNNK